jgi:c-di-GMP-binding flagellar brake protein YcgR
MGERLPKPMPEAVTPAHQAYLIHNRAEIVSLLRSLAKDRSLVTAYYGAGDSFLVTTVLSVNPEFEELILDVSPDRESEARVRGGSPLTMVAFLDHVKLQFHADRSEITRWQGEPAVRVRVPRTLLRLQRRENYRVQTPLLRAPVCHAPAAAGRPSAELRVSDLSGGGLALASRPGEPRFDVGMLIPGCVLQLPGMESIGVDLEVRHAADSMDSMGRSVRTCGCRFLNLPGTASTMIQRYINGVERERRRVLG